MKKSFYKIVESQRQKKSKYDEEVKKIFYTVDEEFGEKLSSIENVIGNLSKELEMKKNDKNSIETEKMNTKAKLTSVLGPIPEFQLFETLCVLAECGPVFYPKEHDFIIELEQLKKYTEGNESVKGLDEEQTKVLSEFVKNHVVLENKKAVSRVRGRVKGYKGDETAFKPDVDYSIELVDGRAEPAEDVEWDDYFDTYPELEDIEWPDHKSTMAYAKIYDFVIVVKVDQIEETEE